MEEKAHIIVSVHGTFSATEQHEGTQWWQYGSRFWQALSQELPEKYSQIQKEQTFHWSGENSAAERRSAAKNLLVLIRAFEENQQPYHLIGHSHGGSVIWEALLLANRKSRSKWAKQAATTDGFIPLQYLRSWATVGTPFVISKPSALRILMAMVTGIVALISFLYILFSPFIKGVEEAAQSAGAGWEVVLANLVVFYIVLSPTLAGLESEQVDRERRSAHDVIKNFGSRWLCLWHSNDEAINGLRAAMGLSGKVVPRRSILGKAFAFPILSRLYLPLSFFFFTPVLNFVLAPLGDRYVWRKIKDKSVGNDRPGAHANRVETMPVSGYPGIPSIPQRVENDLGAEADAALQEAAATFRSMLGRLGNGMGKGLFEELKASGLSGRELIHTSYFDNPDITILVGEHIRGASGMDIQTEMPDDLRRWMEQYRAVIGQVIATRVRKPVSLGLKVIALVMVAGGLLLAYLMA